MLRLQGDLIEARPIHERALAILEKVLGTEHPQTNFERARFARLILASGTPVEALKCGNMALHAHEKLLGQDHPWTKATARVAADALAAIGRADEAVALRGRYGVEHEAIAPE